jgi:hypothetical protein
MVRILFRLLAAVAGLLLAGAMAATPAQAADAVGCRIAPGTNFAFEASCVNTLPASSYAVAFHAPTGSSYSWSVTGDWTSVIGGCGATDEYCTVATPGSNREREVDSVVTVNGTTTVFSTAIINAYCGSQFC